MTIKNLYSCINTAVSLVRKDALINHLLCLHVLHQQYVQEVHTPEAVAV